MAFADLKIQYAIGKLTSFVLAPFYFAVIRLMGYRVRDIRRVRRECAKHFTEHEGPWLVCANHLTMIDSPIITYALLPLWRQIADFGTIPWNLPEQTNFQRNIVLTVLCYLSKCIPVHRGGSREDMKKVLDRCVHLLEGGQSLLIFPEGGRSRTGHVNTDGYSYGVGRFVEMVKNCRVLCVYMRGDGQDSYSTIPRRGERFTVKIEVFDPIRQEKTGLRAQREYAGQIIKRLAALEEEYFASHRQRHCGSDLSLQRGEERGRTLCQPGLHKH